MITNANVENGMVVNVPGFFIITIFEEGKQGRIQIFHFDSLNISSKNSDRALFKTYGGTVWQGFQEPEWYKEEYRQLQPGLRSGHVGYFPYYFDKLSVIKTTNNSRFLSLTKVVEGSMNSEICFDFGDEAMVAKDQHELATYLDTALAKIGVPQADIPTIKGEILSKF